MAGDNIVALIVHCPLTRKDGREMKPKPKTIQWLAPHLSDGEVQAIYEAVMGVIGEDLPGDQPFDNTLHPVELIGNKLFRKGANWTKAEQRAALSRLFGKEPE